MKLKLKVNICSLTAESRLIRKEVERLKRERPLKGNDPKCQELIYHRRDGLRNESRATQLLYGFVRGRSYRQLESKADWSQWKWYDARKRLLAKCKKFGVDTSAVEKWLEHAPEAVEVG